MENKKSIVVIVCISVLLIVNILFAFYNWDFASRQEEKEQIRSGVSKTSDGFKDLLPELRITETLEQYPKRVEKKGDKKAATSPDQKASSIKQNVHPLPTKALPSIPGLTAKQEKGKEEKNGTDPKILVTVKQVRYYPGPVRVLSPIERFNIESVVNPRPATMDEFLDSQHSLTGSLDPFGLPFSSVLTNRGPGDGFATDLLNNINHEHNKMMDLMLRSAGFNQNPFAMRQEKREPGHRRMNHRRNGFSEPILSFSMDRRVGPNLNPILAALNSHPSLEHFVMDEFQDQDHEQAPVSSKHRRHHFHNRNGNRRVHFAGDADLASDGLKQTDHKTIRIMNAQKQDVDDLMTEADNELSKISTLQNRSASLLDQIGKMIPIRGGAKGGSDRNPSKTFMFLMPPKVLKPSLQTVQFAPRLMSPNPHQVNPFANFLQGLFPHQMMPFQGIRMMSPAISVHTDQQQHHQQINPQMHQFQQQPQQLQQLPLRQNFQPRHQQQQKQQQQKPLEQAPLHFKPIPGHAASEKVNHKAEVETNPPKAVKVVTAAKTQATS